MKPTPYLLIKLIMAAALFLLPGQSRALTTEYLIGLSNGVAAYHAELSTNPAAVKETRALARALRDLSKPTTTVAQDYKQFFRAVLHLGDFAFTDTNLTESGVAVFQSFMEDAAAKIDELSERTNALNQFVRTRKAAGIQINRAYDLLLLNFASAGDTSKTNLQAGLVRGNRLFTTLVKAEKLVVKGEAKQGFAPEPGTLVGAKLGHMDRGGSGVLTFVNETEYENADAEDEETDAGEYTYVRTGLNTGTLVLTEVGGGDMTTVKLKFSSTGAGRFTAVFVDGDETEKGSGRFTFTPAP